MARKQEPLTFAGSLESQAQKPLDARRKVALIADLTDAASFPYIFSGLDVYCEENQKWYTFLGGDQTDISNWREEGTGGGGTSDFNDLTNRPEYLGDAMTNKTDVKGFELIEDHGGCYWYDDAYTWMGAWKKTPSGGATGHGMVVSRGQKEIGLIKGDAGGSSSQRWRIPMAEKVEDMLDGKADKATTYTKTETDALVEGEHIELTQAQYTALPEEEKNNGKVYFITDGGAYVPAVDLIPYVNQAPIVVGKLDLRGDGEFRDIKRVRLWINDLKNASGIITAGWVETGVYVRPIRVYGWFTFHDYENTATGWRYIIQQFPIPYHGYQPKEAPSGEKIGLKFYVDHNNKLNMIVDGKSYFNQEDYACVIVDFMETPIT